MTQEDLNLYRNTYNSGLINGIMEFAARLKEEIEKAYEINVDYMDGLTIAENIIALDETERSGAANKRCMAAGNGEGNANQCPSGRYRCCGMDKGSSYR